MTQGTPGGPAPAHEPRALQPKHHGRAVALGGLLFVVLTALVTINYSTSRAAWHSGYQGRPSGVPADAVLCGGAEGSHYVWLKRADLRLADGRVLPAFQISAWDGLTGDPAFIGTGLFVPILARDTGDANRPAALPTEAEILRSASFAGGELRFDFAGRREYGRIVTLDLPVTGQ